MKTIIHNGKVVSADAVIEGGYVLIEDGVVAGIFEGDVAEAGAGSGKNIRLIDANGGWISHGLVDVHIHGCGGHWGFFGCDDILNMSVSLAQHGVTAFLPTTVSLPHAQVLNSITEIKKAMEAQASNTAPPGARILGIHLEGPYISPARPGAHLPPAIRPPDSAEINEILELADGALRIVTMAPEIPGGLELVEILSSRGIVVSIGHSDATAEQTRQAIGCGARHFTHLFNAVRQFHQREPGCAFTALLAPEITAEIILDGRHVHSDVVEMAIRTKGAESIVLVSDSILAAGLGDGSYNVWGFEVQVKNGVAALADGTMAGSVITLNTAVKNALNLSTVSPLEAFRMATVNPCNVLSLHGNNGNISPGALADITVFDKNMNCIASFADGKLLYSTTT